MTLFISSTWAQTAPEPAPAEPAPEQILVVGQRPGPGLWKVTKGEHVLWLFGTHAPLPTKMEWRAHEVETILAQSQEFLQPSSAKTDIGVLRALTLLPLAIGVRNNPDGARLKDVLPPEVYARWLPLKEKYIGRDDDLERERPLFVAERLNRAAMQHAGLENDNRVRATIDAIVKKNKIKVTSPTVLLPIKEPRAMLKEFKKSSMEDVACFTATLDRLENDIETMRTRANAWAVGDIEQIQKISFVNAERVCNDAMTSSPALRDSPEFQSLNARMQEAWLAAADKALENNVSTFGLMSIGRLLDPKGVLQALEARGYTVQRPE
ncbi:TraB/GumN family protein [Massilia sp. CF038]|uniref:TraB/GumN family protein n=1 Tax=Massilia sp. CF038 TaxID=1881045 RepID=UPI000912539B|nr:TraB/GumN family protein [Massilia sp. CF038]SHH45624.1 Uncharacterized conserved protein YbaP, TraB family [Massilia sp. CF038]